MYLVSLTFRITSDDYTEIIDNIYYLTLHQNGTNLHRESLINILIETSKP